MSLKNIDKSEKNTAVLTISVDKETFEASIEKAYHQNAGKINVHGFRKGKAPRRIIEKLYGTDVFYEDAVSDSYPAAYEAAVAESGIEPVDRPELSIEEISAEGYTFTAKVTTKPEVTVGTYKEIEAVKPKAEVSDDEVDAELERRRQRSGRLVTVEREIKDGDTAVIDFEGFIDGVAFEGGKGENHSLKIGSGQFIPGFEEKLVGHKAGEELDVDVSFPEDYHAEELKGKPAVFKCKIHEVKEEILPELDDDFAKDVSIFETLADYKADIKKKLVEIREKGADDTFESNIIDKMLETFEGDIPECMFSEQLDRITQDYAYRMESQGITLENYLKMSGMDMDSFKKTFRPQAERQVKTRLALEFVAKNEGLEISDEDIENEYKKMADQYKMEVEKLREMLPASGMKEDLVVQKAIDFVKSTAIATEYVAPAEEAKEEAASEEPKAE